MLIIAHRGDNEHYPEQTAAAYESAFHLGADGVETDVRLTRCGELVCIHDRFLNRVSDGSGRVSTCTMDDLSCLNFGTEECPQEVLTFRSFLEMGEAYPDRHLFIETKHPSRYGVMLEEQIVRQLQYFGLSTSERVHIISFNPVSIQRIRRMAPALDRIWLRQLRYMWANLAMEKFGRPTGMGLFIQEAKINPDLIGRHGLPTYMFTVNDLEDVDWARERGVKYLATDNPSKVVPYEQEKEEGPGSARGDDPQAGQAGQARR